MATTISELVEMVDAVREQGQKARKLGDELLDLRSKAEDVEDALESAADDLGELANDLEDEDSEIDREALLAEIRRIAEELTKQKGVAEALKDQLDEKDTDAKDIAGELE